MSQAIYVTGTGVGVGKTYVAAALVKAIQEEGYDTVYYKPVEIGSETIPEGDAGYVRTECALDQEILSMVSYLFHDPVAPHLAAARAQQAVDVELIKADFASVSLLHEATVVEGCGGIICPLTLYADGRQVMQEDVVRGLELSSVIVADAGLGTINATLLTVEHMKNHHLPIVGIILNRYDEKNVIHRDNLAMLEKLSGVDVVATVAENGVLEQRKPFFLLEGDDPTEEI